MKNILIALVACVGLLSSPVSAQTQSEKDGLTVEQALTVAAGLGQLHKYETVDKDGKTGTAFYDFSGDIRMLIATNIDIGRRLQTQLQSAQNDLIMKWVDAETGKVPESKINAFNVETAKLMGAPSRVGYYHIKKDDLKLDKNPIPATTLSMIVPIIDR